MSQIKHLYKYFRRVWRRCHRVPVALMVLLVLGLIEPLACIVHCKLWPALHHNHPAAHHTVSHSGFDIHSSSSAAAEDTVARPYQAPGEDGALCLLRARHGDLPGLPVSSPAPLHEMIVLVSPLLLPVMLVRGFLSPRVDTPPGRFFPPPLRPPITRLSW